MTRHRLSPTRRPHCLDCGLTLADVGITEDCAHPGERLADPFPGFRCIATRAQAHNSPALAEKIVLEADDGDGSQNSPSLR